jgi:hypothetical protein
MFEVHEHDLHQFKNVKWYGHISKKRKVEPGKSGEVKCQDNKSGKDADGGSGRSTAQRKTHCREHVALSQVRKASDLRGIQNI